MIDALSLDYFLCTDYKKSYLKFFRHCNYMFISHGPNSKFIFFHVPKAAGSSIHLFSKTTLIFLEKIDLTHFNYPSSTRKVLFKIQSRVLSLFQVCIRTQSL